MKKVITILGLLALITALICVSAFAADAAEGVTNLQVTDGYTVTVQNADGEPATLSGSTYTDAAKFAISYSGVDAGSFQLVYMVNGAASAVPTEDNIFYIDLKTAETGNVQFVLFPKAIAASGDFAIVRKDNKGVSATVATFHYAAASEAVKGDASQNGVLDLDDVVAILQHITGAKPLVGDALTAGDYNGDTFANITDVVAILQALVA